MATSPDKIAEIKAKKAAEEQAKAESNVISKLYANKKQIDNSRNKTAFVADED